MVQGGVENSGAGGQVNGNPTRNREELKRLFAENKQRRQDRLLPQPGGPAGSEGGKITSSTTEEAAGLQIDPSGPGQQAHLNLRQLY